MTGFTSTTRMVTSRTGKIPAMSATKPGLTRSECSTTSSSMDYEQMEAMRELLASGENYDSAAAKQGIIREALDILLEAMGD